jgi:hypothetical protein
MPPSPTRRAPPAKWPSCATPTKSPPATNSPPSPNGPPFKPAQDFSLLDVVIYTGVTHQIRCHLAAAGHPIAGDTLYGSPLAAPRHWLHASRLVCTHPATGKPLDIACPLPADWPHFLLNLNSGY